MNTEPTVLPRRLEETDKTDETGIVSNVDFLAAVFSGCLQDNKPMLASFSGNPAEVSAASWSAHPWVGAEAPDRTEIAQHNNYFTLASFLPDEAGRLQRKKSQFCALHAIMLDDVGTKVARERLTLLPSWLLETSPGNFQAGFILAAPIDDQKLATRLVDAVIDAGLCDRGANGPTTRLARLPVGMNGKHTPAFACKLHEWRPTLRYSVEELVAKMQLDMATPERPERVAMQAIQRAPIEGDPVWFPRPNENAVLQAIRERGLYKAALSTGKHDVTCPWLQEHTDQVDGGTAYFEPDDQYPIGGFKCLHGHCIDRNIHALLNFLQLDATDARGRATIHVRPGELKRILDAAEVELAQSGNCYQRGGTIVTVVEDPCTRQVRIEALTPGALVRTLASVAYWERYDARAKGMCQVDPPSRYASLLLDSPSYPHLPVLRGLARQPYLRNDGSLMTKAGYDAASSMFGAFDGDSFSVPERPSRTDAEAALAVIDETLSEFCFAREVDRSTAIAAIVTAVIRPSLLTAPMFHVRAHAPGTGKSYLCALITAFATPQANTPTGLPSDDTECQKLLMSELLRCPAVIEFDNLTSNIPALKSLCTALTSEYLNGRLLSTNKIATVETRALLLSSGNNVGPVEDMTRRCLTINLNSLEEVPAARSFNRPDLVAEVQRDRARYVSAVLTIVRAWIAAGRPASKCRTLAGFADWSALACQPLLWLGCQDPTTSAFAAMEDDPERALLSRLLDAWYAVFQTRAVMVRDIVARLSDTYDGPLALREVLEEISDGDSTLNSRKVGWWLVKKSGRVVNGMRIVKANGSGSAQKWQLQLTESVSEVSEVSNAFPMRTVTASTGGIIQTLH